MKMKIFNAVFSIVTLVAITAAVSQAQTLSLPQECKYKIGDDLAYANPSFNDAGWGIKELGKSRIDTITKTNIYEWYRMKITIPSSMKALAEKGKGLQLKLGKIDDIDQVFFNGKLIGQTGSFPPDYKSQFQTDRVYNIPISEVQWDKENLISVRVFSPDSWVGMYQGPYNLAPVQWSDFIDIERTVTETANKGFTTTIKFTNNSSDPFDGTINYWVADMKGKKLFSETKPVQLKAVKGEKQEVSFKNFVPANENIFKVGYTIKENDGIASVTDEQLYLAKKDFKIPVAEAPKAVVANKVKDRFVSIPFQNQKQQGYLGKRMNQNLVERLLKLDEVGTLDGYIPRPGHHPWAGEHIGKYLETASNVWKNTGDQQLKGQMDRLMFQLISTQLPDGYLGTYIPIEYWTSWDVWSHKYNLYGLLAYYKATGYQPALDACKKMGDLLCKTFGNKPGQRDIIKAGTHIGMAATSVLDPMVELYKYTADKKYLDFCYYILGALEQENGPKIISALLATGKVTKVGNGKAYEMISNFVGITNLYRLTGDEKLLKPMLIAWNDIVANRLYITGTTSSHEYFQDDHEMPAGLNANMGEGCVTTTWIQFNQQLFDITGDLKYMEQIEKAIYNHLLAAENPGTGCVSYYTPLMGAKPYTCNITCCQSSVPRGIAMIPYFPFGKINTVPTLLMYEPATYQEKIVTIDKKRIGLSLNVTGGFPETGNAVIIVNPSQAAAFSLSLRVPPWCSKYTATVGGKTYNGVPGNSVIINRSWKTGDKINVSFQMLLLVLDGGKSYPGRIAFQRGPQVLAADSLVNGEMFNMYSLAADQKIEIESPDLKSNATVLPSQWIGKQAYTVQVLGKNQQLVLVPFADASQTGGAMKVWLPLSVRNK